MFGSLYSLVENQLQVKKQNNCTSNIQFCLKKEKKKKKHLTKIRNRKTNAVFV